MVRKIILPMAVIGLLTMPTCAMQHLQYTPALTHAANPERVKTLFMGHLLKVWVHSQREDIGDPILPLNFPFLGSLLHLSAVKTLIYQMEVTCIAIPEESW